MTVADELSVPAATLLFPTHFVFCDYVYLVAVFIDIAVEPVMHDNIPGAVVVGKGR